MKQFERKAALKAAESTDKKVIESKIESDLYSLLAGKNIEDIMGGFVQNGEKVLLVKLENSSDLLLVPFDYVKKNVPHLLESIEEFRYFS